MFFHAFWHTTFHHASITCCSIPGSVHLNSVKATLSRINQLQRIVSKYRIFQPLISIKGNMRTIFCYHAERCRLIQWNSLAQSDSILIVILGSSQSGLNVYRCAFTGISGCSVENGNCSQLCFPMGSMHVKCSCAMGYELAADGKTCNSAETFLVYSTASGLFSRIDFNRLVK